MGSPVNQQLLATTAAKIVIFKKANDEQQVGGMSLQMRQQGLLWVRKRSENPFFADKFICINLSYQQVFTRHTKSTLFSFLEVPTLY